MKFSLAASGSFYNDVGKKELEDLGFQFQLNDRKTIPLKWHMLSPLPEIEINSLEELIEFMEHWGELIVRPSYRTENLKHTIEIYNDHRE